MAVLKKIVVLHGAREQSAGGLCKLKLTDDGTAGSLSLSFFPRSGTECLLLQNGRVLSRFPVEQRLQTFEAARLEKGPFHLVVVRDRLPLLYGGVDTNLTLARLYALLDSVLSGPPEPAALEPLFGLPEVTDPLMKEDPTLGDDLDSLIAGENYFDRSPSPLSFREARAKARAARSLSEQALPSAGRPQSLSPEKKPPSSAKQPSTEMQPFSETQGTPAETPPLSVKKDAATEARSFSETQGAPAGMQPVSERQSTAAQPFSEPQFSPVPTAVTPSLAEQTDRTEPQPSPAAATYYDTVKEEIEQLFGRFPHEPTLEDLISDSRFVRVQYDDRGRYYVVGVVYERRDPAFICYGVPEHYAPAPPEELSGFSAFVPKNPAKPYGDGYFMMFQSARTGRTLCDPHRQS